jgi:hypothetical protein
MSDNRTGPPHDLPEYEPNWPVPQKVRAKVYKRGGLWFWAHACPRGARIAALGWPKLTLADAYETALKHARGCW